VLTIPIITRIFSPASFGVFAVFATLVWLLTAVSNLRYNLAILLPKEEEKADALALLGILTSCALFVLLLAVVALWHGQIKTALNLKAPDYMLYLIPLSVLFGGVSQILNLWRLRGQAFNRLAFSKIMKALNARVVNVGAGLAGIVGPIGLVAGHIVGQLSAIGVMATGVKDRSFSAIFSSPSINRVRKVAVEYKKFPLYVPITVIEVLNRELPVILLSFFFSTTIVGYYSLGLRVISQPMRFIGDSVSRAVFQKLSEMHKNGICLADFGFKLVNYLTVFIFFPFILLGVCVPELVIVFFGEEWEKAALFIQLLTPIYISTFIYRPVSVIFELLERQKERFFVSVGFVAVTCVMFGAGWIADDYYVCVGLFSIGNMVLYLLTIIWLLSKIGVSIHKVFRVIVKNFGLSVVSVMPILMLKRYSAISDVGIVAVTLCTLVLYLAGVIFLDSYIKQNLSANLPWKKSLETVAKANNEVLK